MTVARAGFATDGALRKVRALRADVTTFSGKIGTDDEVGERVFLALGGLDRAIEGLYRAAADLEVALTAERMKAEEGK